MKRFTITLLFIIFAWGSFANNNIGRVVNDTIIKEDSMNLAILKLDFLTYALEGINISCYPLCDSCDLDSLPFIGEFVQPVDYGDIKFKYSHNMEVLFGGEVIWMGFGEIYQPETFLPATNFNYLQTSVAIPENAEYFDYWLIPSYWTEEEYIQRADSAWHMIDSLEIVHEFAEKAFRAGFYAYTPTVGAFNPANAKWIIFLYRGNDYPTSQNEIKTKEGNIRLFPNPCDTYLNISSGKDAYKVNLFNSKGQLLKTFPFSPGSLDLSKYNSGIYFLQIISDDKIYTEKLVIQ